MKANEIIQRAKDQADNEFRDYPAQIEREFLDYPGTIQEMAKEYIEPLRKRRLRWINAREEDRLPTRIAMIIDDIKFPEINGTTVFAKSVPIDERVLFVLKNQYLLSRKIDYLKGLIKPTHYKTGLHSILSDEQLEKVYTTFKNKYFATATKDQFFATFRQDPLPEGWKPIKWTGTQSHITYFVELVTKVRQEPKKLRDFITGKTIITKSQTKYNTVMKINFDKAIK